MAPAHRWPESGTFVGGRAVGSGRTRQSALTDDEPILADGADALDLRDRFQSLDPPPQAVRATATKESRLGLKRRTRSSRSA